MAKKFKPKQELIVMCGIPGIGKSMFVNSFFPYHHRVNLDSIHDILSDRGFDKRNLGLGRDIEDMIINDRLKKKIPVVIDNTNVTRKIREKYVKFAKEHEVDINAVYFEPDAKLAISQNKKRKRKVPPIAIYKMVKDFEIPETSEGFKSVYSVDTAGQMFGSKPAVFLDRDGVVLEDRIDGKDHFTDKVEDVIFYENTFDALKLMKQKGYDLFIISNQAGVAYKHMTLETLGDINNHITDTLSEQGIDLSGIYCCTHVKHARCECRKPRTGMIVEAAYTGGIDLTQSYFIGDKTSDIEAGNRIKLQTILVNTGFAGTDGEHVVTPNFSAGDIYQAATSLVDVM